MIIQKIAFVLVGMPCGAILVLGFNDFVRGQRLSGVWYGACGVLGMIGVFLLMPGYP